jgi:hypothetical protein
VAPRSLSTKYSSPTADDEGGSEDGGTSLGFKGSHCSCLILMFGVIFGFEGSAKREEEDQLGEVGFGDLAEKIVVQVGVELRCLVGFGRGGREESESGESC